MTKLVTDPDNTHIAMFNLINVSWVFFFAVVFSLEHLPFLKASDLADYTCGF